MRDDYLFDGSGTPDPDVERLEKMLGRLRTTRSAPPIPYTVRRANTVRPKADPTYDKAAAPVRWRTVRFLAPSLAVAAAIIVMVAVIWKSTGTGAAWEVASLSGTPRIGSGRSPAADVLASGRS